MSSSESVKKELSVVLLVTKRDQRLCNPCWTWLIYKLMSLNASEVVSEEWV